jgi:hypothetical protein
MTFGSGPMSGRLAAYRAIQPPRTPSCAAMPDNVSPCCTTYVLVGLIALTGAVTARSVLVKVT